MSTKLLGLLDYTSLLKKSRCGWQNKVHSFMGNGCVDTRALGKRTVCVKRTRANSMPICVMATRDH